MHAQEGAQGKRGSADDRRPDHAPKKRGDLTATLNPLLEPRLSPGQPGRRRGVSNYEWAPETDRLLVELCAKWGAAKAKHIIGRRLQEGLFSDAAPKPERAKSVEYRMAKLEIFTGRKPRKPDQEAQTVDRGSDRRATGRSRSGRDDRINCGRHAPHREIRPCEHCVPYYWVHEIHGFMVFTAKTLQPSSVSTPRQVRRWEDQGWLETQDRKINGNCLGQFCGHILTQFRLRASDGRDQVYLVDLGFPCPEKEPSKRMSRYLGRYWKAEGSHRPGSKRSATPLASTTARRTRMVMTAKLLLRALLAERGAAHSTLCLPTLPSTRQQPVATPQRKAGDPDIRQARHRDNATRSPHRGIRRVIADVKAQCCEHFVLIGNRERVIERPIVLARTTALG